MKNHGKLRVLHPPQALEITADRAYNKLWCIRRWEQRKWQKGNIPPHTTKNSVLNRDGVTGGCLGGLKPPTISLSPPSAFNMLRFLCTVGTFITWYVPMYLMFSLKLGYLHVCYGFREFDHIYSQSERRGTLKFSLFIHCQHFGSICPHQNFFPGAIYGLQ